MTGIYILYLCLWKSDQIFRSIVAECFFVDKLGEAIAVIYLNMVLSIGQFIRLSITLCLWFHVTA